MCGGGAGVIVGMVWGDKKGNRKDINQTRTNSAAMREETLRKIKRSRVGAGHKASN